MSKMGEMCLSLGMKAKKFNTVKGPGKHFHLSSSCCLCGLGKCGVSPNKVFVVYKPLYVLQERWMWISCGFVLGVLRDRCQDTRLETLGDSAMTSWGRGEAAWGRTEKETTFLPPTMSVCRPGG